jgi:hypothetical protein
MTQGKCRFIKEFYHEPPQTNTNKIGTEEQGMGIRIFVWKHGYTCSLQRTPYAKLSEPRDASKENLAEKSVPQKLEF